jgi:putative transposase
MRGQVHTREFKLEVCQQIARGEKRPAQICREHEVANSLLARWRAICCCRRARPRYAPNHA